MTITVTDVNEIPMFTAGATSIDHEEGTDVLDVDSSDNNAEPAEYTIADVDGDDDAASLKLVVVGR